MPRNDFGRKFLVEECVGIKFSDFLKRYRYALLETILSAEFNGLKIELTTSQTGNGGTRQWFKCPICLARTGTLYRHPLTGTHGCRKCLNLGYKKQHYKGMAELEPP